MKSRLKNWPGGDALVLTLELALVALLAVMLAYWTWALAAPSRSAAPWRDSVEAAPALDVPAGLFAGTHRAAPRRDSAGGVRLLGVVSPQSGHGGRAVLRLEPGGARAARAGETVAPGIVLKEVHSDHVVVERNGALERLKIERRAATPDGQRAKR